MTTEKLFKRYLKEIGVFASNEAKESITFMKNYNELFIPFNSFRWDISSQGHLFWFERAVNWLIFLYNNIDAIEEYSGTEETIKRNCKETISGLIYNCLPQDSPSIETFAFYKELKEIFGGELC